MRTPIAIAILCVFLTGCSKDPDPAPAAAPPVVKPDAGLKDLLKRADAVTPKDAPDTLPPAGPPEGAPEKVVIVQSSRPARSYGSPTTYGSSSASYSQAPSSAPLKSPTESMMEKAESAFGARVSNLSYAKSSVTSLQAQKTSACTGTLPPLPGAAPGSLSRQKSDTADCKQLTAQLEQAKSSFRQQFDGIEAEASRAGIYPGVMRDLYSRHGFNPY